MIENLETPEIGSYWRHYNNGNVYKVLMIANAASTRLTKCPVMVVYQGENGNVWARKVVDWFPAFVPVTNISEKTS